MGSNLTTRVLLVEDDRSNRYAMARLLESFGMEVQEAHTVNQAIDGLGWHPHFLVVDWLLANEDSTSVIRQARAQVPETRIVVVTVAHDRCEEIRQLSPDAIFTKPFNPALLLEWFNQNQSERPDPSIN